MTTPSEVVDAGASKPEFDPSGRVKRIDVPAASPGVCAVCGKSDHPLGFADADLHFEFHGTFYLCADCTGDYARLFGYVSPVEISGMREMIEAQNDELNTLRQAVLGLESTVDGLIGDAHRRITDRAERISSDRADRKPDRVVNNPVDESNAGPADINPGRAVDVPALPGNGSDKQGSKRGRDDLLDVSSTDDLLGLTP